MAGQGLSAEATCPSPADRACGSRWLRHPHRSLSDQGPCEAGREGSGTPGACLVLLTAPLAPPGRYDPDHVCNASDNTGRYTYSKQPEVCKWNLQKLVEALEPELPREQGEAILAAEFDAEFRRHYLQKMRRKLGLVRTELDGDAALVAKLLETMHLTGERAQGVCHTGGLAFPWP